jgi:hypothetical protein
MFMMTELRRNTALKVALLSFVVITGSLSLCGDLYIRFHYAAAMPRSPQLETGRIYPLAAQYGGTIYVNKVELGRHNFQERIDIYVWCGFDLIFFDWHKFGLVGWQAKTKRRADDTDVVTSDEFTRHFGPQPDGRGVHLPCLGTYL